MKKLLCITLLLALVCGCVPANAVNLSNLGSKKSETSIAMLQRAMIAIGILDGKPDGLYGENTQDALTEWCELNDVEPADETILSLIQKMQGQRDLPADLEEDRLSVYIVQRNLSLWGFLEDTADGRFGKKTQKALSLFMDYASDAMTAFLQARESERTKTRQAESLYTGDMPRVEDELLVTADNFKANGVLTREWYDFITSGYVPGTATVNIGDKGIDARRVQKRLYKLKYVCNNADGYFGKNTALALKYFQKRNHLPQTGVCDLDTQRVLFSVGAEKSDQYVAPYMAKVIRSKSRVYIMGWTGSGYTKAVKTFKCSCGAPATPTLKGVHQAVGQVSEWYYMPKSSVWVRYAFKIKGNYFFHSVLFGSRGAKYPTSSSVRNLGSNVSHGCIRLAVKDAKWIYKNCTPGMTVDIT